MSCSLNSLKGVFWGVTIWGSIIGLVKGKGGQRDPRVKCARVYEQRTNFLVWPMVRSPLLLLP